MRARTVDGLGRVTPVNLKEPSMAATAAPQPTPPNPADGDEIHDDLALSQRPQARDK